MEIDLQLMCTCTRIEFFRKNYREIHGNQRIPKFMEIFTVVTVKITVNSCKNSRDFW